MAWNKTDKRRFKSRYSDSHVTIAQYITEYLCELVARQCKSDLPQKFWDIPEWQKFYKFQVVLANKLLQDYHPRALVKALRDRRLSKLSSFVGIVKIPFFKSVVIEYHLASIAEDAARANTEESIAGPTNEKPKAPPSKKTTLGKLRSL